MPVFCIACASSAPQEPPSEWTDETAFFPALTLESTDEETGGENPWLSGWGGAAGGPLPDQGAGNAEPGQVDEQTADQDQPRDDTDDPQEPVDEPPPKEEPPVYSSNDEPVPAQPKPARLIISQYGEGSGSDKRLAFLNQGEGTDGACEVLIYANGGQEPWRKISVEPVPLPGEEVVLCSAVELQLRAGCTGEMSGNSYNGDDALVVRCRDEITDSFGQVGHDPGNAWESALHPGISSRDHWLVRCNSPDVDPGDPFDLDHQWSVVPDGATPSEARAECRDGQLGLGGGSF